MSTPEQYLPTSGDDVAGLRISDGRFCGAAWKFLPRDASGRIGAQFFHGPGSPSKLVVRGKDEEELAHAMGRAMADMERDEVTP